MTHDTRLKPPTKKQLKELDNIWKTYEKELDNYTTCELGSCQYKTIEDTYNWALALMTNPIFGRAKFEELIGITYKAEDTLETFQRDLYEIISEDMAGMETHDYEHYLEEYKETWESPEIDHTAKSLTIEQYYTLARDLAYDLWSAAMAPFDTLDIPELENFTLPTYGPLLNQMAQNQNFRIGIELAYTTFIFGTSLETFSDFDT